MVRITPIYKQFRPFGRGPATRSLGDLGSPWLLTTYPSPGMILQVGSHFFCSKRIGLALGQTHGFTSQSTHGMVEVLHRDASKETGAQPGGYYMQSLLGAYLDRSRTILTNTPVKNREPMHRRGCHILLFLRRQSLLHPWN